MDEAPEMDWLLWLALNSAWDLDDMDHAPEAEQAELQRRFEREMGRRVPANCRTIKD